MGVCAPGQSVKTALLRVYAIILQAAYTYSLQDEYKDVIDPYYSLVGYFNSIRELGGAVRLLQDDIPKRIYRIKNVVQSMINGAERNILITGYSLSSYFSELVDTIVLKSQRGVFVKFFVNDIDKQPGFDKILLYKGRFLKIYNYHQEDDKLSALHAKVISVDQQQTLITSANLSYHGQQGNIELGTLIESKQIAKQIDDVFTKLIFSKIFSEV